MRPSLDHTLRYFAAGVAVLGLLVFLVLTPQKTQTAAGAIPDQPEAGLQDETLSSKSALAEAYWYQWHTFYGAKDIGADIAVSGNGDIYIVGTCLAAWPDDSSVVPLNPYSGAGDMVVVKLNSQGVYQWHTFYGAANGYDEGADIFLAEDGSIYLVGQSERNWLGDGGTAALHQHKGYMDIVVVKLNSSGSYQWHTFYGSFSDDEGYGIAGSGNDKIFITGVSTYSWLGDGDTPPLHDVSGSQDIFVLRLNSAGAYQWHTFYGSDQMEYGHDITASADYIYITGSSPASWLGDGGAQPLHPFEGTRGITVIKLNHTGAYQWHTFYGNQDAFSLRLGNDESIYILGRSSSSWKGDGDTDPIRAYNGSIDVFILKLTSAGAYQWHTFYGGTAEDHAFGITVEDWGSVFVSGFSDNSWNGDDNQRPRHKFNNVTDIFIMELTSNGIYRWHTFYGSNHFDYGYGIDLDNEGNIILTGYCGRTWQGWFGGTDALHLYNGTMNLFALKLRPVDESDIFLPVIYR